MTAPENLTDEGSIPGLFRFTEPCFALFFIPLSVPLRLAHGSTFTFHREEEVEWLAGMELRITPDTPPIPSEADVQGRNFVSLKIWRPQGTRSGLTVPFDRAMMVLREVTGHQFGVEPRPAIEDVPGYAEWAEEAGTVIEAVTPLIVTDDEDHAFSSAFDRCVEEINVLVSAFILASGDSRLARISRQNLYPLIPWIARDLNGETIGGPGTFLPGSLVGTVLAFDTGKEEIDSEVMRRLGVYLSQIKKNDPFVSYLEWARNSRRELDIEGNYAAAINAAHTAGDILLDTILYLMAWEEGLPHAEVSQWFDRTGTVARLRTHYHSRLGGRWSPDDPKTMIGRWVANVSRVRGRVVHAGYHPNEVETVHALDTLAELEEFLKERLAHNRLTYKRTTLLFLGTPGLDRRGLYTGQMRRFVEQEANHEDDWILSYRRWLQT